MWSGPRNISTAMMRAWGERTDTLVCDEPFYAVYLDRTGRDHPGRDAVLASQSTDPDRVVEMLLGPLPPGKTVFYQKHMTHHLRPDLPRAWMDEVVNVFLIRRPEEMLPSLARVIGPPTLRDTGLDRQIEIFDRVRETTGRTPPVLDAKDVLLDPQGTLSALCAAIDLPFDEAMLSWPAGPRETDGVWAAHWYDNVRRSTGFAPYRPKDEAIPDRLQPLLDECRPLYERLHEHRIASAVTGS